MHEVEVYVVCAQVFERRIKGRLHIVRVMRVVPQLSRDEDLRTRDTTLLDGGTDGRLGPVDASCVDVSVSCFQGFSDGVFLSCSILPSSKANGRWSLVS